MSELLLKENEAIVGDRLSTADIILLNEINEYIFFYFVPRIIARCVKIYSWLVSRATWHRCFYGMVAQIFDTTYGVHTLRATSIYTLTQVKKLQSSFVVNCRRRAHACFLFLCLCSVNSLLT